MSSIDLGDFLKSLLTERQVSVSALSRRASLSRESIYRLLRGDSKEPDLSTIVRISRALQVHPILLLRKLFNGWEFSGVEQPHPHRARDAIGFLGDMTYPDNTIVGVDARFTKVWEIQNIGSQPWLNRRMVCVDEFITIGSNQPDFQVPVSERGLQPENPSVAIDDTAPGGVVCIAVPFKAPGYPCTAVSYWKMVDADGHYCFPEHEGLSCVVKVVAF